MLTAVTPPRLSTIELFVRGVPVPQGSKRIGRHGKRPVILDANDKALAPWREHITATARIAMLQTGHRTILGPVYVAATFVLPRPAGHYGTGRNAGQLKPSAPVWPAVRPDLDKYLRACLDGLTDADVFEDDARVVEVHTRKCYGPTCTPGIKLRIEAAPEVPPWL